MNGAREYEATIAALRELYLRERRPGETAAEWLARTGRRKGMLG